jgi:y4mF family transcriptional regulator
MKEKSSNLAGFVKLKRKNLHLTQPALAAKAGVGLRFIREIEQGKTTLRIDKVNQVLQLFGQELGPVPMNRTKLTKLSDESS